VAHDLNNMLAPILGYTELLLADCAPGTQQAEELRQIQTAAGRARDLTRQLLAFGRRQILNLRTVDLRPGVEALAALLRRAFRPNVRVLVNLPATLQMVRADASQLEQALMNLAANAQEAMPAGGTLTITMEDVHLDGTGLGGPAGLAKGPYVKLTVHDTGSGMDPATQSRLFEPFFSTKRTGKTTGLGLATVYGIVSQHGGGVDVSSEAGVGTTFRIFLPAAAGQEAAQPGGGPARVPAAADTATLVVVEDNDSVRELTRRSLARCGYHLLVASGPLVCLEMLAHYPGRVDLLVTDVVMPDMTGRELYDRLRDVRPGLRVLYMSGYAASIVNEELEGRPHVGFIQKPFTIANLSSTVRDMLARPVPRP